MDSVSQDLLKNTTPDDVAPACDNADEKKSDIAIDAENVLENVAESVGIEEIDLGSFLQQSECNLTQDEPNDLLDLKSSDVVDAKKEDKNDAGNEAKNKIINERKKDLAPKVKAQRMFAVSCVTSNLVNLGLTQKHLVPKLSVSDRHEYDGGFDKQYSSLDNAMYNLWN